MTRVLIVAAYAAVRAGLRALLAGDEGCVVVGEAAGSAEAGALLAGTPADVVLLDYADADGPAVLRAAAAVEVGVVVLGDSAAGAAELAGYPLRGWAYLLRDAEGGEIAAAARAAAAGLVAVERSLMPALLAGPPPAPGAGGAGPAEPLTARERDVLQLMAQGLPNKVIAARLGISLHTVKFHVASILSKLGAGSRTEAVTLGLRGGQVAL